SRHVHQATLNHVPAQQTLQPTQYKQGDKFRQMLPGNPSLPDKVDQWEKEDYSDEATQHAVSIFIGEDTLELRQFHAAIDQLIFGKLLVLVEDLLPGLL